MLRPAAGVVVPGIGGLRKLRFAARGQGKRGGARVIYYWVQTDDQIVLLYAYAKNETSDITAAQARQLRNLAGD
ncbi:MAG: type II toxin-antitoxin system RelE/ParE family toxin [Undibacterium sp.]|nr:type II toxin-antitoxin system RelE/ParE family toxin [Opitutaceae bacterium]